MMSGCTTPEPELVRTVVSEKLVCKLESKAIGSPIIYSPDARRVAYIAEKDGKKYVVIDGVISDKGYDSIDIDFGMFSLDSKRTAYRAVNYGENPPSDNEWFVVIDGEEGDEYQTADEVTFSPDSKHVAYVADNGVYLDRVEVKSPPGGTVCEDKGLLFSPDSEHLVYVVMLNDRQSVVVDGVPGKQYDKIDTIVFSPDSNHLAYTYEGNLSYTLKGNPGIIIIDGEEKEITEGTVCRLMFSPDSKRLAYIESKSEWRPGENYRIIVDRKKGEKYEDIRDIIFSPDSKHIIYINLYGGKMFVVVDKTEGKDYDFLSFTGVTPSAEDLDINRIVFDSADKFHYLVKKGDGIYLVEETLKQDHR
jgi:hypothetical protein